MQMEMIGATNPTNTAMRVPQMILLSMSWPIWLVPKGNVSVPCSVIGPATRMPG